MNDVVFRANRLHHPATAMLEFVIEALSRLLTSECSARRDAVKSILEDLGSRMLADQMLLIERSEETSFLRLHCHTGQAGADCSGPFGLGEVPSSDQIRALLDAADVASAPTKVWVIDPANTDLPGQVRTAFDRPAAVRVIRTPDSAGLLLIACGGLHTDVLKRFGEDSSPLMPLIAAMTETLRRCDQAQKEREKVLRLTDIVADARLCIWEYDGQSHTALIDKERASLSFRRQKARSEFDRSDLLASAHPDDVTRLDRAFAEVFQGKTDSIECEIKIRNVEGNWQFLLLRGHVTRRDRFRRVSRISGVAVDLTEQRATEGRLHAIMEAASVGTWQVDHEIGRSTIDAEFAAMLGYTLPELTPYSVARFESMVHPDDLVSIRNRFAEAYARRQANVRQEFRMRHRNGNLVWILASSKVLDWTKEGRPIRESGVNIDISQSKSREAELSLEILARKTAEQRFSDIASVSEDWFWEQDNLGRFTYISEGFERLTRIPKRDLIGQMRSDLPWIQPSAEEVERIEGSVCRREAFANFIYKLERDDIPEPKWIRISGAPFFDFRGEFAGYRGVGGDVTALVEARETAQAGSRAKSQFLANMSHELRTPLTGVLGMTDLLNDTALTDEQRSIVDTIRFSGSGLMSTLNDILDISKIEANKLSMEEIAYVPAKLLTNLKGQFGPLAASAGLALRLELGAGSEQTRLGDPNRISQVFNNLVSNAIKFTEAGSVTIALTCGSLEDGVSTLQFTVTDTGIGMADEVVGRVFNKFEQAELSTSRRFGGVGLGLSITRRLVHLMGGTIDLRSALGQGTTITVILPAPEAVLPLVVAQQAPPDLTGKTILLADDTRTNRLVLGALLKTMNATVIEAQDGFEALDIYRPGLFDLLLLDISMPGKDGVETLSEIRALERASGALAVPAYAVTANAMLEQVDEYLAAGFDGHLAKPICKTALRAVVSQIVTENTAQSMNQPS